MKPILILAFSILFIFSCKKDNNNTESLVNKGINGKWNLINVSCECQPVNLEKGEQVWYIDSIDQKITVNNYVIKEMHTILESGEYPILLDYTKGTVKLNDVNYIYWIENEILYIADHPWSDGPLIRFERD